MMLNQRKNIGSMLTTILLCLTALLSLFIAGPQIASAYTPHSPININGDADFAAQALAESWPGDGSSGNPYIIEGYEINGGGSGDGIHIENTDVHFIIRDCYVHDVGTASWDAALDFEYSNNGTLMENVLSEVGKYGISIYDGNDFKVANNTISGYEYAIRFEDSNATIILNNTVSNNIFGIYIYSTHNNTVADNTIYSNFNRGLHISLSNNSIIAGNNISSNNGHGIVLGEAYNIQIENNNISSNVNGDGIQMTITNDTGISNNTMLDDWRGIHTSSSTNTTIYNNTVKGHNQQSLFLEFSDDNIIIENDVDLMTLTSSDGNRIENNSVYGNINLFSSDDNKVKNNSGDRFGMDIDSSNLNVIMDNRMPSSAGMELTGSNSNTVVNNSVFGPSVRAIKLVSSSSNVIYHNTFIDNRPGYISSDDGTNQWDNGYPSGGNYWGLYSGNDDYNGPNQNILGSDGIGDTPYNITGGANKDKYPLMLPKWGAVLPTVPRNLQASGENDRITLTWESPTSDGGSSITNYKIYRGALPTGGPSIATVGVSLNYDDLDAVENQIYYYSVSAINGIGEGGKSNMANASYLTNLIPTCAILSPETNDVVSGVVTITVAANDIDGWVQKVEVRIDDGSWMEADGNNTWNYTWDTSSLPEKQYTIYARSFDGMNYSKERSVTVTVRNDGDDGSVFEQPWFWIVIAVVIAVIVVLLLMVLRRRKGSPPAEFQPVGPPPQ
jgi:parallel beta-helix repeat protein